MYIHSNYSKSCPELLTTDDQEIRSLTSQNTLTNLEFTNENLLRIKMWLTNKMWLNFRSFFWHFKACLRLCSTPQWKKSLYRKINSDINNWNVNWNYFDEDYLCVNSLDLGISIKELGYSNTDTNDSRLAIQFLKEFILNLAPECSQYEMAFVYTVKYRKITNERILLDQFIQNSQVFQTVV